jgi:predicted 3-demethylubiquinone-9 3-methyltransferase (glyoxalase superfamily)
MSALEQFPRITPFLWFNSNLEEAVKFYLSIFKNSRRLEEFRQDGKVTTIAFELDGQRFTGFNGGPMYKFTEAISMVVRCDSQDEVDYYWSHLSEGGKEIQCGWLRDRFGLFWQVVPARLPDLLKNPNAFQAMMHMKKLDIAELERAAKE